MHITIEQHIVCRQACGSATSVGSSSLAGGVGAADATSCDTSWSGGEAAAIEASSLRAERLGVVHSASIMLARLRPLLQGCNSSGGGRLQLLSTARGLASSAADADNALYEQGEAQHVGSIVTASLGGKGRGLINSSSLAAGELVMCALPAVVLHGEQDAQPDADLLVPELLKMRSALAALYDGTGAHTRAPGTQAYEPGHYARSQPAALPMCHPSDPAVLLLLRMSPARLHRPI